MSGIGGDRRSAIATAFAMNRRTTASVAAAAAYCPCMKLLIENGNSVSDPAIANP